MLEIFMILQCTFDFEQMMERVMELMLVPLHLRLIMHYCQAGYFIKLRFSISSTPKKNIEKYHSILSLEKIIF